MLMGHQIPSEKPASRSVWMGIFLATLIGTGPYPLTGCSGQDSPQATVQDEEDKIVFTIQMESIEEDGLPVSEPMDSSAPSPENRPEPPKEKTVMAKPSTEREPKLPSRSIETQESPSRSVSKAEAQPSEGSAEKGKQEVPSNQEASLLPVATPDLPEDSFRPKSDEEKIRAVIRQQEVGMETGDRDLIYASAVKVTAETQKELDDFFERYTDVEVTNVVERIEIEANTAEAITTQTTHVMVKKTKKPAEVTNRMFWRFVKKGGDWKISQNGVLQED